MGPLYRVRKEILKLTQAEIAEVAKTRQATVSRWERGELEPSRDQLALVLEYARVHGIDLTPADFFGLDESASPPPPSEGAAV